jgi:hypothetical protein
MATKLTRYRLKGTTAADGTATINSNSVARGKIHTISCEVGALDNTADVLLTTPDEVVNQTFLNLTDQAIDVVVRPKILCTGADGSALTATGNIYTEYCIFSRIRATISQGGATKAFVIDVYVEEY